MTNFKGIARVLRESAAAMEADPSLDPDGAVRQAVWGHRDAPFPGDGQPGADLFDEASSAIECKTGWQGHGIEHIPQAEAIAAARAEAARFGRYA
ncbi:hypothetical protein [Streptomyces sp. NPDC088847]|uniref:hypothetical protein n=1 Tax=Streptomyces sp. NPDC088847 TaxID=3365909 RepID=UPI003800C847